MPFLKLTSCIFRSTTSIIRPSIYRGFSSNICRYNESYKPPTTTLKCSKRTGYAAEKNASGLTIAEGWYHDGKKHGMWTSYYTKSEFPAIHTHEQYSNGTKTGIWIKYNLDGSRATKCSYNDIGQLHGTKYVYKPNGDLRLIINYKNGLVPRI